MAGLQATHVALLNRLEFFRDLAAAQLEKLAAALSLIDFKRGEVICRPEDVRSAYKYILVTGLARLTSASAHDRRLTMALISPGLMFTMPRLPVGLGNSFQWEAFGDCKVGRIAADLFVETILGASYGPVVKLFESTAGRWASFIIRYPSFLNLDLAHRLAAALLELGSELGVRDSRGTLLRAAVTHRELAEMVGGSRPKVTEHLAEFERDRMIVRDGRHMVILPGRLESFIASALPVSPSSPRARA